ncbi:SDR family oxidoreductase [Salinisphaera sp. SWV1]|uniref:SDR family oxidoreductase n=1 Tax=Salinisphaera sp. SWV1 TaxID=3454139 RepID=UPI003F85FA84
MKTVLITGCSSGFGLETARYFLDRDWHVIATMRTPRAEVLPTSPRLQVLALDVTDPASVAAAVEAAGAIDVLVNNAGVGAAAPFELTEPALARALFETNTIGAMAMCQALLPQFRARGAGTIVNVTSTVTLKALPLLSLYTASKAAVNAFTACMAIELAPFGIAVRTVLPGRSPETRFGENAHRQGLDSPDYADLIQRAVAEITDASGPVTHAADVAEAVWRAATDPAAPSRIPAGRDAVELARETGISAP